MLDWGWLKNKNLVLKEFANKPPLPVEFNDQEVVVDPGGWIDGATIKGSSLLVPLAMPQRLSRRPFSNVQFELCLWPTVFSMSPCTAALSPSFSSTRAVTSRKQD